MPSEGQCIGTSRKLILVGFNYLVEYHNNLLSDLQIDRANQWPNRNSYWSQARTQGPNTVGD